MVKRRKKPSKGISLDKDVWVRKQDVKETREVLLEAQEGVCAITDLPLEVGVLDHDHGSGYCRGVLLSEVNMLEGKFLRQFNKQKLDVKYGLSFPELLISMGEYLAKDYTNNKVHYGLMESWRKQISRLTKPIIQDKLHSEFGIESTADKSELVRLYVQAKVDEYEGGG